MQSAPVLFSRSCEYAVQALLYLAHERADKPILLRRISHALEIPHHFLNKILHQLVNGGILVSHRGVSGGFSLARPAARITVGDVVKAVDGEGLLDTCVLGFPGCSDDHPCPVHPQWKPAKRIILRMMNRKSIATLSRGMGGKLELIRRQSRPKRPSRSHSHVKP